MEGPKEDSMLLWGAYHYGIGNWEAVREDPDIPLSAPNLKDSQLTRRLEILLRAMRAEREERAKPKTKPSKSKATPKKRGAAPPTPSSRKKTTQKRRSSGSEGGSESSEGDGKFQEDPVLMEKARRILRTCRDDIKDFRDLGSKDLAKDARIAETKGCLLTIGVCIDDAVRESRRRKGDLERHLWHFVAEKTAPQTGATLQGLYGRLRDQ